MAGPMFYIVRGLPSAGKTELAKALAPQHNASPDDFRIGESGLYHFDTAPTMEAINRCAHVLDGWMRAGVTPIAVASVSYTRGQVLEWVALAIARGYQYTVVHVESGLDDAELAARSRTACPAEKIASCRAKWQPW